jgi:hypothetical protein
LAKARNTEYEPGPKVQVKGSLKTAITGLGSHLNLARMPKVNASHQMALLPLIM